MIVLFSKGCPNPSAPSASRSSSLLPLPAGSHPAKGRPPLRSAPLPLLVTGLAAGGSPLRVPGCKRVCPRAAVAPAGALQLAPFVGSTLQASVLAGGCRPYELAVADRARRRRPCGLLPPRAAPASLAGWPWSQPVASLQGAFAMA
ncbi:hypothetical protein GW17_00055703 [Ensete ventricosum]|nr:hypothetical protein GW17_00055703 [Ensete ventricosum]